MSKKKLFVMCGNAGCGKSTWIQNNLHTFEGYTTVVSRDMIRFLLVHEGEDYFSRETEVYAKFIEGIQFGLENTDNVIADATHLNEGSRGKLLRRIGPALKDVEVIAVVIEVPLKVSLDQNEKRQGSRSYVPRSVIRRMYHQFTMPTFEEGFDKIYVYNPYKEGAKYTIFEREDK